tara:strand:- start:6400 stop:7137 length:738 start_codon:yes stop_codon:yes gene_type:complete
MLDIEVQSYPFTIYIAVKKELLCIFLALTAFIPAGEYGPGGILMPDISKSEGLAGSLSTDGFYPDGTIKMNLNWNEDPLTWNWFWAKDWKEDTFEKYGFSFRYVPFENFSKIKTAFFVTPYYWETTDEGSASSQFGINMQYLIESKENMMISFGASYGHDTAFGSDNTEMEPIFSIGKQFNKSKIRAEFRGGGDKSLPKKTAFSIEQDVGKINIWLAYTTITNLDETIENGISVGLSMDLPWPLK